MYYISLKKRPADFQLGTFKTIFEDMERFRTLMLPLGQQPYLANTQSIYIFDFLDIFISFNTCISIIFIVQWDLRGIVNETLLQ